MTLAEMRVTSKGRRGVVMVEVEVKGKVRWESNGMTLDE